ncbi:glycosyltransferase family 8 protein [Niallia sp. JL1B1071]|uniref:glycosyltransferase family 8 protein n=1 Tax=Niallia tiangongensis TaxID=3237105 RepID=UPI0037DD6525
MMDKINLVFSVDNQYSQHFAAALTSLLVNNVESSRLNIVVIDGGIEETKKKLITEIVEKYNGVISFKKINRNEFNGANLEGHISEATYYRLMIPELFSEDIKKVIYLDCDILVRNDITELWNTNIGDFVVGAIKFNEYDGYDKIDIPKGAPYFNAGVLVINLDKWRKEQITRKSFEYIKNYPEKLIAHDQSILNFLLYDKWFQINYKWNLRTQLFSLDYKTAGFDNKRVFEQIIKNPAILHFTTASKPWHYLNNHPFKKEYFYYLDKSAFPYVKYPELDSFLSKEIVIFGTGEKSKVTTNLLEKFELEVSFYLDNDEKKWEQLFLGKHILPPFTIVDKPNENNRIIIIASHFSDDISEQLIEMGFENNIDFIMDISTIYTLI